MSDKLINSKYGKEITVEQSGNYKAGRWAEEQMKRGSPYAVGYMDDPFEGIRPVVLPQLNRHTAFIGQTGYGKSTAVQNIALQADLDVPFTYIDPKGDEASLLEQKLSKKDSSRVQVLKLKESSYSLNLLNQPEKFIPSTIEVFIRFIKNDSGTYWGPSSDRLLRESIECLMRLDEETNLEDLFELLSSESKRQKVLSNFEDPNEFIMLQRLGGEVPQEKAEVAVRKIQDFLENKPLADFLNDGEVDIGFQKIELQIEENRSCIVNAKGIPEDAVRDLYVYTFKQTLETLYNKSQPPREQHLLFMTSINEFSHPQGWFPELLAKSRGLNTSIVVSCTSPSKTPKKVKDSIFGNCGNLFLFRVSDTQEANKFSTYFEEYGRNHFLNLNRFQFTAKIINKYNEQKSVTGNIFPLLE